jgi:hypothetical protein
MTGDKKSDDPDTLVLEDLQVNQLPFSDFARGLICISLFQRPILFRRNFIELGWMAIPDQEKPMYLVSQMSKNLQYRSGLMLLLIDSSYVLVAPPINPLS